MVVDSIAAVFPQSIHHSRRSQRFEKRSHWVGPCNHSRSVLTMLMPSLFSILLTKSAAVPWVVSDHDLACPNWEADMLAGAIPVSQALADRLIAAGYVGMLVQSFATGTGSDDHNLVVWTWGQDRPARIALVDDEGRLSGVSIR